MKKTIIILLGLACVFLLPACSLLPQSGESDLLDSTAVYGTVAAGLTETAPITDHPVVQTISAVPSPSNSPVPSTEVTISSSPTISGDPLATPKPTRLEAPCNLAAPGRPFVDITIPDGTHFNPGESFSKTWRLVNAGSCDWTPSYAITWFSGELFGAVTEQRFGLDITPGQYIDITVDMTAPQQAGVHQSNWKLRDANGSLFGIGPNGDAPFWVRIEVEDIATATVTPEPTLTFTPTPAAVASGSLQIDIGVPVDLDTGNKNTGVDDDLELQEKDGNSLTLTPLNGAAMAAMTDLSPVMGDCLNASLNTQPVAAPSLAEGAVFCFRTSQGLPGYFRIEKLGLDDKQLTVNFLTWAIP